MLYYLLLLPAALAAIWVYAISPALSLWWLPPVVLGCFLALVDWLLAVCRVRIHTEGMEKLPQEGEFLFVSNHRSAFDPLATLLALRDLPLAFISKPENIYKLIVGRCAYRCCFLPIDRDNARSALKTINAAAERMRAHECSYGIYPEGTRSKTGELQAFRSGALKAAQKANVPIVVATIDGTEKVLRRAPWRVTDVYLTILGVVDAQTVRETSTRELSSSIHAQMRMQLGK